MPHIKRFEKFNNNSSASWVDNDSVRKIVESMKPENSESGSFKIALKGFNSQYKTKNKEQKINESFNAVNWADMNLIQEVLYRMDPRMCNRSESYKKDLKIFLEKINSFNKLNEQFSHAEWVDVYLLQEVIDNMKSSKTHNGEEFKKDLRAFNVDYKYQSSRFPSTLGKRVADWVDSDLVQDVIDRMNPHNNPRCEEYKAKLKEFVEQYDKVF
jgi:hypothetical protein